MSLWCHRLEVVEILRDRSRATAYQPGTGSQRLCASGNQPAVFCLLLRLCQSASFFGSTLKVASPRLWPSPWFRLGAFSSLNV
jgi:hypothetical protein